MHFYEKDLKTLKSLHQGLVKNQARSQQDLSFGCQVIQGTCRVGSLFVTEQAAVPNSLHSNHEAKLPECFLPRLPPAALGKQCQTPCNGKALVGSESWKLAIVHPLPHTHTCRKCWFFPCGVGQGRNVGERRGDAVSYGQLTGQEPYCSCN